MENRSTFAKVMGKNIMSWFFINFMSTLFSPVWQPAREQTAALQPNEKPIAKYRPNAKYI